MKITRLTVFHVDLPLEHPYWLSGGRLKFETLDATFVKVETDAGVQTREITVGGGHAGGSTATQHFGLAAAQSVDIRIKWPGREWSDWTAVNTNQSLVLDRFADGFTPRPPDH